jgi:acyl-coenzyme A thioesterase PaaI-like protein
VSDSESVTDGPADRPTVYPPPHQVLSALGIEVRWSDADTMAARSVADPSLLGRSGRPCGVGALVPIVDLVAGARVSELAGGDWLATSDVWLHERSPIEEGPIEIDTRVLRAGKRTIVSAHEVTAGGRPALLATVEFTRIRREASAHTTTEARVAKGWTRLGSGPLLTAPLEEACGLRVVDPANGVVELGRSPFVANSTGTLQGGVVALLADVAAAALVGPGTRTVDLQYRFLAPTGDGPARTAAEVVRVDGSHHTVQVEVVDASTGALVGWAICGVRPG